jgi:serine protease AprX
MRLAGENIPGIIRAAVWIQTAMNAATRQHEHEHEHAPNRFAVIPVAERLDADRARTGRGVTIAVLDSGFHPHPDIRDRIVAYHDVTSPGAALDETSAPWHWHGTQTAVTAAGNGALSGGVYHGLARDAALVLVKVSDRGRITDEDIVFGLEWVIANRHQYNIRVVSMSLGGDAELSFTESLVDEAAERAVRAGLTLVVAAGNAGCTPDHRPIPPANSPSVITVGGYDDGNTLDEQEIAPYCSSFGPTVDGLLKPEIVAPAIWVAAPILPNTEAYRQAEALSSLATMPDYRLRIALRHLRHVAGLPASLASADTTTMRAEIERALRERKIVATHYQHVDGTSFAAPIVASVVAQMLEVNPRLTPALIKNLLVSTADRSGGLSLHQQGYGVLNARRAVAAAAAETHVRHDGEFTPPRVEGGRLVFRFHHDTARRVALAGDFNGWRPAEAGFVKQANGIWRAEIELPAAGRYEYKFVVNDNEWLDDPSNGEKAPDNHGGFNSVVRIIGAGSQK